MIGSILDFYNPLVLQQANTNNKTAAVFHHPMQQHGALFDTSNQTPSKIDAWKKGFDFTNDNTIMQDQQEA